MKARTCLRSASLGIALALSMVACSDSTEFVSGDGGASDQLSTSCSDGETRCRGRAYEQCVAGRFQLKETCSAACSTQLGCTDCDPSVGNTCKDGNVHGCNSDGSFGALVEECLTEPCQAGKCTSPCDTGTQLIYVVDRGNMLRSFDPRNDANTFKDIGPLQCPASAAWPEYSSSTATPFAMTIDQKGRAWVLYTSGEIFWVDTKTGACEKSPFVAGTGGYKLFTLGFSTSGSQGGAEDLYIFGGEVGVFGGGAAGKVAKLDLAQYSTSDISGAMTATLELTGTGNGRLFGFEPNNATIQEIDKQSGATIKSWSVGSLGSVTAYACVHWGGRFYMFITEQGLLSRSRGLRFDPATGRTEEIVASVPYRITGAGVSTCAPFTIK
jgi:hypothetical protein